MSSPAAATFVNVSKNVISSFITVICARSVTMRTSDLLLVETLCVAALDKF